MDTIRVVIADDHPIFRSGLRDALSRVSPIEIVGEADNGIAAYQLILSVRPDVAILDIEMPLLSGLDICQKVQAEKSDTRFVVLTMHHEPHYYVTAMQHGVMGYLLKDNAIHDLVACVRAVATGGKYICEAFKEYDKTYTQMQQSPEIGKLNALLTPTERVILKLIGEGKTSIEIAELLFVSPNTIDNHRANMMRKLGIEGKNALLKFAMQLKGGW